MLSPSIQSGSQREFARETKFLIAAENAGPIESWVRAHMTPDSHGNSGKYLVKSLCFDNGAFDSYHRRGSFGRSKYRVRLYDQCEWVFLERKLKSEGRVGKTRSMVGVRELAQLAGSAPQAGWAGRWFHRRLLLRELRPVCQISYSRTAFFDGAVRLTIDANLRALRTDGVTFDAREGTPLLEKQLILELKYRKEMPALFQRLVGEFSLQPQAVSKYRTAVEAECRIY